MRTKPIVASKLSSRFTLLLERVRTEPPVPDPGPIRVLVNLPYQKQVRLNGRAAELYEAVLQEFLDSYAPNEGSPTSAKEVQDLFDRALLAALGSRGQNQPIRTRAFARRVRAQAAALHKALQVESVEWRVYVPLEGPLVPAKLAFGQVEFLPSASRAVKALQRISEVGAAFHTTTIAKLVVRATDGEAARALAGQRLRQTLDVLDFIGPTLEAPYLEPTAAFQSIEGPGASAIVAVGPQHVDYTGIDYNVRLRELPRTQRRTRLERLIHELLRIAAPNRLQTRLVNAIAWAGRANVERRRDQAFLMKMIALESALTMSEGRNTPTERLRARVAQIVGGSLSDRRAVFERMMLLYQIRSSIVHSGTSELTDTIMKEISALTRRAIEALLTSRAFSRMTQESQLERWFEDQTLLGK